MNLQCTPCKIRYDIIREPGFPICIIEGISMCLDHLAAWMRYLDYIGYMRPLGKARAVDYDIRHFIAWLERSER